MPTVQGSSSNIAAESSHPVEQGFEPARLRPKILLGCLYMSAEFRGCVPWPARIVQDGASQRDQIRIAGADDRLGLLKVSDHSNRDHWYLHCGFHRACKRNLIA